MQTLTKDMVSKNNQALINDVGNQLPDFGKHGFNSLRSFS